VKPIIKWVGGKTQLLPALRKYFNKEDMRGHTLYEPFIGGGALTLDLAHESTVLNDLNSELINMYEVVRDYPDELILLLKQYRDMHSETLYYHLRNLDREESFKDFSKVSKAARTIYLNKTCFNGLYRVNSKGYFNSPMGKTASGKTPEIVNEDQIKEISKYLKTVRIENTSFSAAVKDAKQGDFVFFDPPYDQDEDINSTGFVGYQKNGWTRDDTIALKNLCDELTSKGVHVVLTNNDTSYVRELFADYEIEAVDVRRNINRNGSARKGREVIISNKLN